MFTALTALIARCRPRPHSADAELLRRFAQQPATAAFEELLQRHAVLVWGVCRRILSNEADCEDAFQATFLALVRRANTIDARPSLGAWLHTVALRIARKARMRSRRQQPQAFMPEVAAASDVVDEVGSRELFRLVDEEIERLPALLRLPLILCCLQGRTRDEAAETLGCSVAAVKSRLERGRDLLRRRLQRRGVQPPAAFLVLGLTTERIRAALWAKTMQSTLQTPAPALVSLAEAGVSAGTIGKGKLILAALLLVSSAAGVAGTLLMEKPKETPASSQAKTVADEPDKKSAPQVRTDRHGDPLPAGALARLGTVRWRHGYLVEDLAYSPDGKSIAVVGCGRDISLWNAETGKELHHFPNKGDQPTRLAFSPDGKILAATDRLSRLCRLWDVATGKQLRQLRGHQNDVRGIAFSPDGKRIATASNDETIRLWDPANGNEQLRIDAENQAGRLVYSSDGKWIATGSRNGIIHLWSPETGKEQRQLSGHKAAIWSIVFSPDGKRLASSGQDGTIRLWDMTAFKQSRVLAENKEKHEIPIAISPDGALLASGHEDGTIRLWDAGSGTEKRRWQGGVSHIRAVAFSPDGKTLASGGYWEAIRLWDVATGREKHPSDGHRGTVESLQFASGGTALISIGREQQILRWDLAANKPQQMLSWMGKEADPIALSPDGKTLAMHPWSRNQEVRLLDLQTRQRRSLLGGEEDFIGAIAFSFDGRLMAAGGGVDGAEQVIHIWDVRSGKEIRQIKGCKNSVNRLCFSPDSKVLACGMWMYGDADSKRALSLWDIASSKELFYLDNHERSPNTPIAFSPDGKVLAFCIEHQESSIIRLCNARPSNEELARYTGHREPIDAIAFSPNGKLVASGAAGIGVADNSVHVWEAATGRLIRRFAGHHSGVGSVGFAPDGLTVASGGGDSTILLWDITGRRIDGRWHAKPLTPRQLDACWKALADADAAKAYDAVWALVAAPEQALPYFQKHLLPAARPDAKTVAELIAKLDSEDFTTRQQATEELRKLGDTITSILHQTLEGKPSLEVRRRIEQLVEQTHDWTTERLRVHRAIQVLEHIGTQQAKEVLQNLAAGAADALRTQEANAALRQGAN